MDKADLKAKFGVDVGSIPAHASLISNIKPVPGRVLHIDGDFLAYQVSADDSKKLKTMQHNHDVSVETLKILAKAETAVLHITGTGSTKGGRYDQAIQKEYQVVRKGKEKPEYLQTIKDWMVEERGAIRHNDQEADDGLCQANWEAIQHGDRDLNVIVSKDKDLLMCEGLRMEWDTGDIEDVVGFGKLELKRNLSSPKLTGVGTSFFWAQMVIGDTADSIKGVPKVSGAVLNVLNPTKAVTHAKSVLAAPDASKRAVEASQKVLAARKWGPVGPVLAYELLKGIKNDKQAFKLVKALYKKYGEEHGFAHWKTGEEVSWQKVFVSEAQLLWMRRTKNENDVLQFLKGCQ